MPALVSVMAAAQLTVVHGCAGCPMMQLCEAASNEKALLSHGLWWLLMSCTPAGAIQGVQDSRLELGKVAAVLVGTGHRPGQQVPQFVDWHPS